jgi:thiopurine S-methyltransferase
MEPFLIHADFFEHEGQYDLILEHTFFCALDPAYRQRYVSQMAALLKPGGKLVGLLFDFPLTEKGPPFGGSDDEYLALFREYLLPLRHLARCQNSVPDRAGKELFFIAQKPDWTI